MATIDIRKPHGTTTDDAAGKMRGLLERFAAERAELVKDVTWGAGGQSGAMTGKGFKGRFEVDASSVVVAIDLSFIARPFKGRIERELTQLLNEAFGA